MGKVRHWLSPLERWDLEGTKTLFLSNPKNNRLQKNMYFSDGWSCQGLVRKHWKGVFWSRKGLQFSQNLYPYSL